MNPRVHPGNPKSEGERAEVSRDQDEYMNTLVEVQPELGFYGDFGWWPDGVVKRN